MSEKSLRVYKTSPFHFLIYPRHRICACFADTCPDARQCSVSSTTSTCCTRASSVDHGPPKRCVLCCDMLFCSVSTRTIGRRSVCLRHPTVCKIYFLIFLQESLVLVLFCFVCVCVCVCVCACVYVYLLNCT